MRKQFDTVTKGTCDDKPAGMYHPYLQIPLATHFQLII